MAWRTPAGGRWFRLDPQINWIHWRFKLLSIYRIYTRIFPVFLHTTYTYVFVLDINVHKFYILQKNLYRIHNSFGLGVIKAFLFPETDPLLGVVFFQDSHGCVRGGLDSNQYIPSKNIIRIPSKNIHITLKHVYIYTSGGTKFMLLESLTKHPSRSTADHISKSISCGRCGTVNYHPLLNL